MLSRLGHEIPADSHVYFGKSADLKRRFENFVSKILKKYNFEEIITPFFSYHQNLSIDDNQRINLFDADNNNYSLRADSTVDVVRIVRERFKEKDSKRIFYIQPTLKFPTKENYQVGVEFIGEQNLPLSLKICNEIFSCFSIQTDIHIGNIEIPNKICKILDLDINIFKKGFEIEVLRERDIRWVNELMRLNCENMEQILDIVPIDIKDDLLCMKECAEQLKSYGTRVFLTPLYYSQMRYYNNLYFRFFDRNKTFCSGGNYVVDGQKSSGFGINIDNVLEKILEKGNGHE